MTGPAFEKALNFGHTFGHVLESVTAFRVSHGLAVDMGMLCALDVGRALGVTNVVDAALVEDVLRRQIGAPWDDTAPARALDGVEEAHVAALLAGDKEGADAKGVTMVLLQRLGTWKAQRVSRNLWRRLLRSWRWRNSHERAPGVWKPARGRFGSAAVQIRRAPRVGAGLGCGTGLSGPGPRGSGGRSGAAAWICVTWDASGTSSVKTGAHRSGSCWPWPEWSLGWKCPCSWLGAFRCILMGHWWRRCSVTWAPAWVWVRRGRWWWRVAALGRETCACMRGRAASCQCVVVGRSTPGCTGWIALQRDAGRHRGQPGLPGHDGALVAPRGWGKPPSRRTSCW